MATVFPPAGGHRTWFFLFSECHAFFALSRIPGSAPPGDPAPNRRRWVSVEWLCRSGDPDLEPLRIAGARSVPSSRLNGRSLIILVLLGFNVSKRQIPQSA